MADLSPLTFWRLFHSLLRHSNGKEESTRAQEVYTWVLENMTQLRKCCVDYELDLAGVIANLSRDTETLPTYDLLKEKVAAMEANEGALEALKEYEGLRDTELKVHAAPELEVLLKDHTETFQRNVLGVVLDKARRIVNGTVEHKKRKLSGAKDAVNYIMERLEEGVIIGNTSGLNRPIVVQNEAEEIVPFYQNAKSRGFMPSGFPQIEFMKSNFVGVLGHAGQGKSVLTRFWLYTLAENGYNCLDITIENDAEVERNKFVLLHAHNPKFEGEFKALSYENFRKGRLTSEQESWLPFIAKDFKKSVGGRIIIRQPQEATWQVCKGIIETQDRIDQLDVAAVDYWQLLEPPSRNSDDRKIKMSADIKDGRQYALTFGGNRKLLLISPVQGNEEGFKYAKDNEGVWPVGPTGINNDKELGRSMDMIAGVFQQNVAQTTNGIEQTMVISPVKDRDGGSFQPFRAIMSACGWFRPSGGAVSSKIDNDGLPSLPSADIIGEDLSGTL